MCGVFKVVSFPRVSPQNRKYTFSLLRTFHLPCQSCLSWFFLPIIIIVIIIIIIVIILGISFMQGIYTYIPETNHVPRQHCVATILM